MLSRLLNILFITLLLTIGQTIVAQNDPNDAEGTNDPPYFSRMKGFHIYQASDIEFDRFEFETGPGKIEPVEGHFYSVSYYANEGITLPSGLQIVRNYTNAAKSIGGKQIYQYEDGGLEIVILKINKNNAEIWVKVDAASNGMYNINLVEKQAMNQDIVADASSLESSIKETGKVAVYGIYFDTGKSNIKPESDPSLSEIAKMLQANTNLKVYVVGHTDNVGSFDNNLKLSKDRADSVVKELISKYSINSSRLQPFGVGPTSPVASNQTDDGRAKNRRVELVAQ